MNNYEYIIASLPVLQQDNRNVSIDVDEVIAEIRAQLGSKDSACLDTLLSGYDPEKLSVGFYSSACSSRQAFIRDYFRYDLLVRNAKVAYLNKELGRAEGLDMVVLEGDSEPDSGELPAVEEVLERKDILERERGLDDLMWNKVDELTVMHVFDLDLILGFVAKMKIIDRWLKLDPQTGRELFRKLVDEIRNTKN